jgi:DNA ligase 1
LRAIAEALFEAEYTRARTAKVAALARALAATPHEELGFVARFLTGALVRTGDERTLGVGGSLLFDAITEATGIDAAELGTRTREHGDLGTAAEEARARRGDGEPPLRVADVAAMADTLLAAVTQRVKVAALRDVLVKASPREARYVVRAVLGEMRVGAREGIVEEAIAKAFARPLIEVRSAAGLVSDVGDLACLAFEGRLAEASVRLGRPVGFMLATPIETARGADLRVAHAAEDKIDGIRAQAHIGADGIHLFARGKGAVTGAFPDVTTPLEAAVRAGLKPAIVDGELVVMAPDGRPRPFSAIQPRLKKTIPDDDLVREHPACYLVYDLLWEDGATLLGLSFRERRARLEAWARGAPVLVHPSPLLEVPANAEREVVDAAIDRAFGAARARGYEGLVLKRLDAVYAAGVRGFAWLKVKKALATLDVVIVAAERGHGKRAGVLSDYTFAVRAGDALVTIGKAYSGLTDVEIAQTTERLRAIATAAEEHGYLPVRPEIVMEVAFDGLQRSERHSSGFALRFPRIARLRDDKTPDAIDTIESVRALWQAQLASGHREESPAKKGRRSGRRPDVRKKSKQLRLFDDD